MLPDKVLEKCVTAPECRKGESDTRTATFSQIELLGRVCRPQGAERGTLDQPYAFEIKPLREVPAPECRKRDNRPATCSQIRVVRSACQLQSTERGTLDQPHAGRYTVLEKCVPAPGCRKWVTRPATCSEIRPLKGVCRLQSAPS